MGSSCDRWEEVLNRPYPSIVVELPFTDHVTDLGAKCVDALDSLSSFMVFVQSILLL